MTLVACYVSVGHQQMMTDPMRPLGLSLFQMTALRPMYAAAGRLFVDVTDALASPVTRDGVISSLGKSEPLIGDALATVVASGFLPAPADDAPTPAPLIGDTPSPMETDPAIVADLIERTRASVVAMEREIRSKNGIAVFDFIEADIPELKRMLFDPLSSQAIMAGMEATWWLNDHLEEWLGEKNAADVLAQSAPNNVTSEMGLALLDVADVIRPHPEVVAFLQQVGDDDQFLHAMAGLSGGPESRDAILGFLDVYGIRCVGEIDITRPRWNERPTTLVPIILGNVRNFSTGEGPRRFEQGLEEARAKREELVARVRALPDGYEKADEVERMIDRLRTFIGFREYPKFGIVSRYSVYKQALTAEAERLVEAGVVDERDDVFYLTFQELRDVVRTGRADKDLVVRRKDEFLGYQSLTPPRVLRSDGESVGGEYRRTDIPVGALIGLPVSAGVVEGRARVVLDIAEADLDEGDILVTAFTDPSWTPVFVTIAGLVTEVGGAMTHGAVIAREYGLPAVVCVEHATALITDGQRIRLHGTDGYIELLS